MFYVNENMSDFLLFEYWQTAQDMQRCSRLPGHPNRKPDKWDVGSNAVALFTPCAVAVAAVVVGGGANNQHISLSHVCGFSVFSYYSSGQL